MIIVSSTTSTGNSKKTDRTPNKDSLVVQRDWNAKVWRDAQADWGDVVDPSAMSRQMREVSDF